MLPKHPDDFSDEDLRGWIVRLVADRTPEGRRLDYKEFQGLDQPKDRREVAKDVSSFANEAGGTLLYGIPEERNRLGIPIPRQDYGIDPIPNFETRVEDILVGGISPMLPEVKIRSVEVTPGKFVYLVWTPESWAGIHMVEAYQDGSYYHRGEYRAIKMSEREVRDRYERLLARQGWLETFLDSQELNYVEDRLPPCFRSQYIAAPFIPLIGKTRIFDSTFRQWLESNMYPNIPAFLCPSMYGVRTELLTFDDDFAPYAEIYHNGAINSWAMTNIKRSQQLGLAGKPLFNYCDEFGRIREFLEYAGRFYSFLEYSGPLACVVRISHPNASDMEKLLFPMESKPPVSWPRLISHDSTLRARADISAVVVRSNPRAVLKMLADSMFRAYGAWDADCFDQELNMLAPRRTLL